MAKKSKPEFVDQDPTESTELKSCFIITPIGSLGSETFLKADGLIKSVLKPVLAEFGFKAVPAYEIDSTGSITKQIINAIVNDELVIANLTGNNPNVMYELAVRHAFKKKVITMAENGTQLPFDISDQRTIFFEDSLLGSELVKPKLRKAINDVLKSEVSSNPVIDSIKEAAVINASNGEIDFSRYFLERFDRLERMLTFQPFAEKGGFQDDFDSAFYPTSVTFQSSPKYLDDPTSADLIAYAADETSIILEGIKVEHGEFVVKFQPTRLGKARRFINLLKKEMFVERVRYNK